MCQCALCGLPFLSQTTIESLPCFQTFTRLDLKNTKTKKTKEGGVEEETVPCSLVVTTVF